MLSCPGAFDPSGLADALWEELGRRHGVWSDDRSSWPQGLFPKLTAFGKSGVFAAVATPTVAESISSVMRDGWHETDLWGQPLVSFPSPGPWRIPKANWHLDMPWEEPLAALRLFAYLTDVGPGGGGTLVVAGSHHLAAAYPGAASARVRQSLRSRHDWFDLLWRPDDAEGHRQRLLLAGTAVDGVAVRVVELTGRPGDLVVWHPALLHTVAPNCAERPRFMLTHTAHRGPARPGA